MLPDDIVSHVFEPGLDDGSVDEDGGEEEAECLEGEGEDEGEAALGAELVGQGGEEEAAEDEGDEGGEGFEPAVGLGCEDVVGGAEADEDGVACLHGDEGAVGWVDEQSVGVGTLVRGRAEEGGRERERDVEPLKMVLSKNPVVNQQERMMMSAPRGLTSALK